MELLHLIGIFFFAASITHDLVSGKARGEVANLDAINAARDKISMLQALTALEQDATRKDYIQDQINAIVVPLPKINQYHGEHDGFSGPFGIYSTIRMALDAPLKPSWVREGISCRFCASFTIFLVSMTIYMVALLSPIMLLLYMAVALRGVLTSWYSFIYHRWGVPASEW